MSSARRKAIVQELREQGRAAYAAGKRYQRCPHQFMDKSQWQQGWLDAEAEYNAQHEMAEASAQFVLPAKYERKHLHRKREYYREYVWKIYYRIPDKKYDEDDINAEIALGYEEIKFSGEDAEALSLAVYEVMLRTVSDATQIQNS